MSRNLITGYFVLVILCAVAAALHGVGPAPQHNVQQSDHQAMNSSSLSVEQRLLVSGPMDINAATSEELEAIPRIGPSLAQRIRTFRDTHGPFNSLEQLLEIKGIGPQLLKVIKPFVTTGPTVPEHGVSNFE